MTDAVLTLRIRTDASGSVQVLDDLGRALGDVGQAGQRGGGRAASGIEDVTRAAIGGRTVIDQYVAALLTIGSARFVNIMIENFDAADGRIQRALGPLGDYLDAQDRALDIANRTGQAYGQTAGLASTLSGALKQTGVEAEQLALRALGVVSTINEAVALGGGAAASQQAGIEQLTQSLQSGLVQGDELRSILEQTPRLAQAIADGIGVAVGDLRELAESGELTSARVIAALQNQAAQVRAEFDSLPPSISRSFTGLLNSVGRFVNDMDEALGVTTALAGGLDLLAAAMGPVFAGATAIVGVRLYAWAAQLLVFASARAALVAFGSSALAIVGGLPGLLVGAGVAAAAWAVSTISASDEVGNRLEALNESYRETLEKQRQLAESTPEAQAQQALSTVAAAEARLAEVNEQISNMMNGIGRGRGSGNFLSSLLIEAENLKNDLAENRELAERLGRQLESTGTIGSRALAAIAGYSSNLADQLSAGIEKLKQEELELRGITLESQASAAVVLAGLADGPATLIAGLEPLIGTFGIRLPESLRTTAKEYLAHNAIVQGLSKSTDANKKSHDDYSASLRKAIPDIRTTADEQRKLKEAQGQAELGLQQQLDSVNRSADARADSVDRLDEYILRIQQESDLIGLSVEQRAELQDAFEIEAIRRREIEALTRDGLLSKADEIALDERLTLAIAAQAEARARNSAEAERLARGNFGSREDDRGNLRPVNEFSELLGNSFDQAFEDADLSSFFTNVYSGLKDAFTRAEGESGAEYAERLAGAIESTATFINQAIESFNRNPDAPLRAITEIASRIPGVVGAVAGAVQAVDALFGGRLLGTNYSVDQTAVRVAFGDGGFTGSTQTRESRQRSFFRGRAFRTTDGALDDATADQLQDVFVQVQQIIATGARELATTVPALIRGSFEEIRDANGQILSRRSTVNGVTRDEDLQSNTLRLIGENVIALVSQVNQAADSLAERFRGTAETLVDAAQLMLSAQTDISRGNALFEGADLGQTVDLVARLAEPGEALLDAYTRIQLATISLREALDLSAVSIGRTGVAFVEFASELATAAGSAEQAQALFADYFQFFYSEQERGVANLRRLQTEAADALTGLNIDPNIDPAAYRAQFEALLPTLSPEQVVRYLEAGRAIALAAQAQEAYTAALLEAATGYATSAAGVAEELALFDASEYVRSIAAIRTEERERVAELNRLARAAGLAGAAESDLANVAQLTALQMARAVSQLESRLQSAAARLAQFDLDLQISALEAAANASTQSLGAFSGGLAEVGQASSDALNQQIEAIASLREYLDRELFGESSTLTPREKLAAAQSQFNATAVLAQGGDPDAQRRLVQLADQLLRQGVSVLGGSSAAYGDLRNIVRSTIEGIIGAGPVGGGGGGGDTGLGVGGSTPNYAAPDSVSPELRALYAERDQRIAEQQARERLALAQEVADYVRELVQATGKPLAELGARLPISIEQLVSDLGVNLDEITVATVTQLASVANRLGVELTDLAGSIGVDLGSLADAQSLLNQGLQAAVAGLPLGQAQQLQPYLDALSGAVTDADANTAIANLTAIASALGGDVAEALAPFLPDLDLPPALNELDRLVSIDQAVADILAAITDPTLLVRNPTPPPTGETGDPVQPTTVQATTPLPVQQPVFVVPQPQPEDRLVAQKSAQAAETTSAGVVDLKAALDQWMARLILAVQSGASLGSEATNSGAGAVVNAVGEVVRAIVDERRGS